MEAPAALRVEPLAPVSQQEMALLVLGFLRDSRYPKTLQVFTQETQELLKGISIPNAKSLFKLVSEYTVLKQREKEKMNLMRTFAEDPTSPLHRTLASLTLLLDDYRSARQSLATEAPVPRAVSQIHMPPPPLTVTPPLPQSPAKSLPISPMRIVSVGNTSHRVVSPVSASAPTPVSAPIDTTPVKPQSSALRRKAFRPRKIVLSEISPSDLVPLSPTGEAPSDAPIANVLRDVEKSQKLAESISSRIAQGLPEGIDLEHMGNILTDLCDDPEMAHLFDADPTATPLTPALAPNTTIGRTLHREQLEHFSFSAPKRRRTDPSPTAPPPAPIFAVALPPPSAVAGGASAGAPSTQADVEEFLNRLKYKPPPL